MAKIMLVEDDNSLREIYEARLAAEGYTVVTAKDGEEALAMALKERPELIIADIMMPKVSGFDMLDILRSTPETKNTKIIMMTALSQAEDKARAEKLGADRYLVKSQVTLEDVTREARAILDKLEQEAAATVASVKSEPTPTPTSTPPASASAPTAVATPPETTAPSTPPAATPAPTSAPTPAPTPAPTAKAEPPAEPKATTAPSAPTKPTVTSIPVSAPDDDDKVDDALEKAAESLSTPVKKEEAEVNEQVDEFIASNPTLSSSPEPGKKANSAASDAVDSLTKPADKPNTEKKPDDEPGRAYVAQKRDDDKTNGSLAHTKTIQPTPDSDGSKAKPTLNELLAKEGETLDGPAPIVNSVITPNDSSGAPSTS